MDHSTRFSSPAATATPLDCLTWGERNLSALAKLTASRMNGGEADTLHLAATFGLLRARQQIRSAIREGELLGRAVK